MKSLFEKLLDQLLKHGLLVTLLGLLSYVYWVQNNRLHSKIEVCNTQIIEIYKEQNDRFIQTLEKNTEVMSDLSYYLKTNR